MVQMLDDKITYAKGYNSHVAKAKLNRGMSMPNILSRDGGLPLSEGVKEYQFYTNPYSDLSSKIAKSETERVANAIEQYALLDESTTSDEERRNKIYMNVISDIFGEINNEIDRIDKNDAVVKIGKEPTGTEPLVSLNQTNLSPADLKDQAINLGEIESVDSNVVDKNTPTLSTPLSPDSKAKLESGDIPDLFKLNSKERDRIIRTMIGEAEGEGELGQAAIAHIIFNRLASGKFGKTINHITRPSQFSAWRNDKHGNKRVKVDKDSDTYKNMSIVLDKVLSGEIADPTNFATHYWSPSGMLVASDNKKDTPTWGKSLLKEHLDGGIEIGRHIFAGYNGLAGVVEKAQTPLKRPDAMNIRSFAERR